MVLNTQYCVTNGTSALIYIGLMILDIKSGDEVIIPNNYMNLPGHAARLINAKENRIFKKTYH